eukprot:scaffold44792_cov48-Phaeocystis_antarctica.AAC.2
MACMRRVELRDELGCGMSSAWQRAGVTIPKALSGRLDPGCKRLGKRGERDPELGEGRGRGACPLLPELHD